MSGERGKDESPDVSLSAGLKARKVRFDKEPEMHTAFRGDVSRRSYSESQRHNLPEKVQKGVEYHDASIRWKALGWVAEGERPRRKNAKGGIEKADRGHAED